MIRRLSICILCVWGVAIYTTNTQATELALIKKYLDEKEKILECSTYQRIEKKLKKEKLNLTSLIQDKKILSEAKKNELENCTKEKNKTCTTELCNNEYGEWLKSKISIYVVEVELSELTNQEKFLERKIKYYCQQRL